MSADQAKKIDISGEQIMEASKPNLSLKTRGIKLEGNIRACNGQKAFGSLIELRNSLLSLG